MTGKNIKGPAPSPLTPIKVSLKNTEIVLSSTSGI